MSHRESARDAIGSPKYPTQRHMATPCEDLPLLFHQTGFSGSVVSGDEARDRPMHGLTGESCRPGAAGQATRRARGQRVMARWHAQGEVVVTRRLRARNDRPGTVACRDRERLNDAVGRRIALVHVTDDPTGAQRGASRGHQRRRQYREQACRHSTQNHRARINQPGSPSSLRPAANTTLSNTFVRDNVRSCEGHVHPRPPRVRAPQPPLANGGELGRLSAAVSCAGDAAPRHRLRAGHNHARSRRSRPPTVARSASTAKRPWLLRLSACSTRALSPASSSGPRTHTHSSSTTSHSRSSTPTSCCSI